ncbi:polisoprenol-linked O-antigen transporter [Capnocytophaga canimorsus]|uniref:oligosaccharide flippase family protein n=1 Tax=Capnocytophaga canimorsus TaxID=28188 RepID=UPI001AC97CF3|nr:oligosaccharide flippase family protein [Capnocytophaga canimorsus]GIM56330.1 polisoprenol-linked O-antigen transporter [Capnocytophaga canimorsus]
MNKDIKNILTNTFHLYLVQGLNLLLPLLVLPYLIETLSAESFGIYSFAFAFSQFILLFVDFGFNISATKKIAENYSDEALVKDTFWNIVSIKFFLGFASLIITILLIFSVETIRFYGEAILWSFVMVLGSAFFPLWWFQGMSKMKEMSIINAMSKFVTLPLIFVFVKEPGDYAVAILLQSVPFVIAAVLSFGYIAKNYRYYFLKISFIRERKMYAQEFRNSWGIFLSNSSISLYTNSLTLLLGFFSTNYNVGLFGAMERIVRAICFGVMIPINQACFPVIARMKRDNFVGAKKIFKWVSIGVFSIMLMAYLSFLIGKNFIIERFFEGYTGVDTMLNVFILMIFPISLGGVIGQLGLLGLGGEPEKKIFSRIYIWIGLLSIPLSVLCIAYLHLWGAIMVMMCVEMFVFASMTVFSLKFLKTWS